MNIFRIIYLSLLIVLSFKSYSQTGCAGASPFCSGSSGVTFPAATTGVSAGPGPNYGCLFSQPNPAWYYFQVSTSGSIIINIAGTGGGDVDFICWGPFTTPTGGCTGGLTIGNTVGCSYSSSPTETCTILGAIAGQYYMLLITNFSGMSQNITFGQNPGSTGSTNCSLLSGIVSKTICPGSTTSLTATSNLLSPTYLWNPGGLTTPTITINPSSTTIYTVNISGIIPGSTTPTVVTNSGTVTVLSNPILNLFSNSMICPGSSINLTASAGFTNYVWAGPPAFTSTTTIPGISIPSATNSMIGTYTVIGRTTQGCSVSATTTVGLVPTSSIVTTPSYTVCQGGTQNFTSTNAIGASYYSWIGPSSFTSSLQNPTIVGCGLSNSGVYTVTAYFVSGTTTCTTVKTCTVSVVPALPSALPNISNICNNGLINLTSPSGAVSYNWSGPNSFLSSLQNPSITNAGVVNNGTYTVTITTGLCVNVGTLSVSVYNPLSFLTTPSNITLCFGKNGILSSTGLGGSGIYNYTWSPLTGLSSPNSSTTSINGSYTTTYSVTLTDFNCPVTNSVVSTVTVNVNPLPVITMTTSNSRGCEIFCTDLISSSFPASASCQWHFSNNTFSNNYNSSQFCFNVPGTYGSTLTVTDINGCVDSTKSSSFVIVDPNPKSSFSWTPENPTVLINQVDFVDESTVGLPIVNWHWDFDDVLTTDTSNIKNPFYIYDNPNTYSVSLRVKNTFGCLDSVTKIVKVDDEFALFIPNAFTPTKPGDNDIFKVSGIGFVNDEFEMLIFNRWGDLIFKTNDINKGWDGYKGSKLCKLDNYVYKIIVKDFKNKIREFTGYITLL